MLCFRIAFDALESHPSDRMFGGGRLLLLITNDGHRSIAIERGCQFDIINIFPGDGEAIAQALQGFTTPNVRLNQPKDRLRRLDLSSGVCLQLVRDNRGDPYSEGIDFRFGGEDMDDRAHFYLEACEIAKFAEAMHKAA